VPDVAFPRENVAGQPGNIVDRLHHFTYFQDWINTIQKGGITRFFILRETKAKV